MILYLIAQGSYQLQEAAGYYICFPPLALSAHTNIYWYTQTNKTDNKHIHTKQQQ